jgi:hypothetical protein
VSACKEAVLAVIGGGRWARVIVSVLAKMDLAFDRLIIVSSANSETMVRFIEGQQFMSHMSFDVVASLDELLTNYNVNAAIVANSAHQHFATSSLLIDHGVNVLIEKPVVLSMAHAHTLLKKAVARGICLVPGLQYRFCSYIHDCADELSRLRKVPLSFFVEWSDQIGEIRYGETKTYDRTIDIAQDVMPHIWAILSTIFQQTQINIDSCQNDRDGLCANFSVTMNDGVQGQIRLQRDAVQRQRIICIQFNSNESLSMDFSYEPGTIYWNKKVISLDPNWDRKPKPLASQLHYFLSTITQGVTAESDIRACLDSVSFSEQASILLHTSQKSHREQMRNNLSL